MTGIPRQPENIKSIINRELAAIRLLTKSNNNETILKELHRKLLDIRNGLKAFSNLPLSQEINISLSAKILEMKDMKKIHYNSDKHEVVKNFNDLWSNPAEYPNRLYIWAENSANIFGKVIFDIGDTNKTLYLDEYEKTCQEFEYLDELLDKLREHNEDYDENNEDDAMYGISDVLPDGTSQRSQYDSYI